MKRVSEKYRQRFIRIFLSSALNADLTSSELDALAEAIAVSELRYELAELLHGLASGLRRGEIANRSPYEEPDYQLDEALRVVKNRRLPKEVVLSIIASLTDKSFGDRHKSSTVREALSSFFEVADVQQSSKLIEVLEGASREDPYLVGIRRKS